MQGKSISQTTHIWYVCPANCDQPYCAYCQGGLATCVVCGASECELPTTCPGVKLSEDQKQLICNRLADYVNGEWHMLQALPYAYFAAKEG